MEPRTYTKINTLYKRHQDGPLKNCIIIGELALVIGIVEPVISFTGLIYNLAPLIGLLFR